MQDFRSDLQQSSGPFQLSRAHAGAKQNDLLHIRGSGVTVSASRGIPGPGTEHTYFETAAVFSRSPEGARPVPHAGGKQNDFGLWGHRLRLISGHSGARRGEPIFRVLAVSKILLRARGDGAQGAQGATGTMGNHEN